MATGNLMVRQPGRLAGGMVVAALLLAATASAQSTSIAGEVREVVVARGDTLRAIGSRAGVDPATLARDNGVPLAGILAPGLRLRVDGRHIVPDGVLPGTIVVNVPQRMLFLGGTGTVRAWPVAAGRRTWPTPIGPFTVVMKEEHPTWDVPASIMEEARRAGVVLPRSVPPGPNNPLGDYWLGLSVGGVGIHGTNAPTSIYQLVTHGCIRLHPDDIAALFPAVPAGARGMLIYQPVLVAREKDVILLEVHPDVYKRSPAGAAADVRMQISKVAGDDAIDWAAVARVIAERAGVPRAISVSAGHPD